MLDTLFAYKERFTPKISADVERRGNLLLEPPPLINDMRT